MLFRSRCIRAYERTDGLTDRQTMPMTDDDDDGDDEMKELCQNKLMQLKKELSMHRALMHWSAPLRSRWSERRKKEKVCV